MNDWEHKILTRLSKTSTTKIHQIMVDCDDKKKMLPDWLLEELFEDSTVYFEDDSERSTVTASEYFDFDNKKNKSKVRIGRKYQAAIPSN